ncbi:dimethylmenaquinone methyltransferase [Natrialba chahannaoensis JCM 10990]|uniref:Dimethylmenaquinone methyltransferase n=1 Tax=Natrialba chahannaoensis JCM 10990 TaxID=1227492 RepID=M0B1H2_9EURY|nr:dimethylmenaquinone methyltransferase [Natrialba chahannaoensis JCM 10990]
MMSMNTIDRVDSDTLEAATALDPNDLGHHFHFGFTTPDIQFMETTEPVEMVGQVITVRIPPEDSTMVHKATEIAEPGDVIVVDMQGHTTNAPWGEMTTRAAIESGVTGAVIDGSITDSREIDELEFPVYARGKSARTTRLHGRGGEINSPVQVGGSVVNPGDIAIGNEDGVLFLRREKVDEAIEYCKEVKSQEKQTIEKLENGASLADLTAANELLDQAGN